MTSTGANARLNSTGVVRLPQAMNSPGGGLESIGEWSEFGYGAAHPSIGCGNTRCVPHSSYGLCLDCLWGEVIGPIDDNEILNCLMLFLRPSAGELQRRVRDQLNGANGEVTGSDDVLAIFSWNWWLGGRSSVDYWGLGRTTRVPPTTKPKQLFGGAGGKSFIGAKVKNAGAGKGSKLKKDAQPPVGYKSKDDADTSAEKPQKEEKEDKPKFIGPVPVGGGKDRAGGVGPVGGLSKIALSLASRLGAVRFAAPPAGPTSFPKDTLLIAVGDVLLRNMFLSDEVASRYSEGSLEQSRAKDRHIVSSLVRDLSNPLLYDVYDPGAGSSGLCGVAAVAAGAGKKLDRKDIELMVTEEVNLRCHDPGLKDLESVVTDPEKRYSSFWERAGKMIPPDASYDDLTVWLAQTFGGEVWLGAYAQSLRVNLLVLDEKGLVHSLWASDSDWQTVVIKYRSNGPGQPGHWLLVRPKGSRPDSTYQNLPLAMTRKMLLSEAVPTLQEIFLDDKATGRPVWPHVWAMRGCGFEPEVKFDLHLVPKRLNETGSYLPLRLQNDQQDIVDTTYDCTLVFDKRYIEILGYDDLSTRRRGLAGFCDSLSRGARRAWRGLEDKQGQHVMRFQLSKALFGAYTEAYFKTLSVKHGDRIAAEEAGMVAVLAVRGVNYDEVAQRRNFMFRGLMRMFGPNQFLMMRELIHKSEMKDVATERNRLLISNLAIGAHVRQKQEEEANVGEGGNADPPPPGGGAVVALPVFRDVRQHPGSPVSAEETKDSEPGEAPTLGTSHGSESSGSTDGEGSARGRGRSSGRKRSRAPSRRKDGVTRELVGGLVMNRPRLMGVGDPKAYVGGKYGERTVSLQAENFMGKKGSYVKTIKKAAEKENPNKQGVMHVYPLGVPNVDGQDLGGGLYPAPGSSVEIIKAFAARGLAEEPPYKDLPDFSYFAEKMVDKLVSEVSTRLADLGPEPDAVEEYKRIAKGKRTQAQIDKNVDLYQRYHEGTLSGRELRDFCHNSCFLKGESNTKLRDFCIVEGKPRLICTMSVKETIDCSRLVKVMEVFEHGLMGDYMVSGMNSKQLAETLGEASLGRVVATDYSSWEATATSRIANVTENRLLIAALKAAGWFDTLNSFQDSIAKESRKVYAKNVTLQIDGRHSGKYLTYFGNCLLNMMMYWWNVVCLMAETGGVSLKEATDKFLESRPIDKCKPVFSGDDGLVAQGVMKVERCRDLGALFSVDYATFEPGMGPFCSTYAVDGDLYGPVAAVCMKLLAVKKGLGLKPGKVKFLMRMAAYSAHLKYGDHPVIGAMVVAIGKATAGVNAFAGWSSYTDYWRGDAPDPRAVISDFPRSWSGAPVARRVVVARGGIERSPVDYISQLVLEKSFLEYDWSAFSLLGNDPFIDVAKACGAYLDGCGGHGVYRHSGRKLDVIRALYAEFGRVMPEPAANTPFVPEWDGRANPVSFFAALRQ